MLLSTLRGSTAQTARVWRRMLSSGAGQRVDTLVENVRVVRPTHRDHSEGEPVDVAIKDGKFVAMGRGLGAHLSAQTVVDGRGMMAFPGVVDAHSHVGIYNSMEEDAVTESKAAAMGGVTSSLNYIRAGQYYLNKGGPYQSLFPEFLQAAQDKFWVDYAFHVAPISSNHIKEMGMLADDHGVTSFKIFMFYGNYGLHGRSTNQNEFLMLPEGERYDIAHFEFVMRELSSIMARRPELRESLSLSLHCELGDILSAYTKMVESEGKLTGLPAYSAARPPHSEGLAIFIASYLAHETNLPNINLLHLTSRKAMDAALMMEQCFPHINFRREVTVGHLLLDTNAPTGYQAKVNPPIRPREDVEYLWEKLLEGKVDWVTSDHACCNEVDKCDHEHTDNIFKAKSGFGGTEWLLSGLLSEGTKRGLSPQKVAKLLSYNPARRYGLQSKGDIMLGYDADMVLVDPNETFTVRSEESYSQQGYSPFEGQILTGRVKKTLLRGNVIYEQTSGRGEIIGGAQGKYLPRPYRG